MNKAAEAIAKWAGSVPFIIFHVVWFSSWYPVTMGLMGWEFEQATLILTLIVSLEAIFLSLFILRAENVQSERLERYIKQAVKDTRKDLDYSKRTLREIEDLRFQK